MERKVDGGGTMNCVHAASPTAPPVGRQAPVRGPQKSPSKGHRWPPGLVLDTLDMNRDMASQPKEPLEDPKKQSFWMPGNYARTVQRTDQSFQACNDVTACFLERAKVEKLYAQQLSQWSSKWKAIMDSRPVYGSLMRAWQCFFASTERLAALHSSISQSLVAEEGERVKTWQKETFPKKLFCGFKESYDNKTSFSRAQKPWSKKLTKLEKVRLAYHKACQKEQAALEKEKQVNDNPALSEEKKLKTAEAKERAAEEREREWLPPVKKLKRKRRNQKGKESRPVMIGGVKVRALYDYVGEEADELSFRAGETFLKVEEEDDQGWCRGVLSGGKEGFYPANYAEVAEC
ncbi:hypothetical protein CCH79_00015642 [Gambusia affinis]|uniref:SH3 domain-containing protein n=1 Tax=Gambusia affinis TaxID=33528 RepID=A0A315VEX1_GAMAF|nr:hypothetical protein CCH79_00015642 [Gambusia affinis]